MLKADLHIHSNHSGHAYGSIYDIIEEARRKKMEMIAITDHGPSMAGTSGPIHFYMGNRKPVYDDIQLLWGIEANLIDAHGTLDIPEGAESRLDLVILGIHPFTQFDDLGKLKNTNSLIKAIEKNPCINFMAHPMHYYVEYEFEPVWDAALSHNVFLELNLSYLTRYSRDNGAEFKTLVDYVKKNNTKLIVNTDSHFLHEIGDDSMLTKYRDKIGLEDSLILNNDLDELKKSLSI
jgi:putative hydrolase